MTTALQKWGFIFEQLGKESLREILFSVAMQAEDDERMVVEFRADGKALPITDHVDELEADLDQ